MIMTVEERLRELILKRYGTLKNFTKTIGISNSTFSNIIRRGIMNANVLTIIKICKELNIDAEALAEGRIVPVDHIEDAADESKTEVYDIVDSMIQSLLNTSNLTINGIPATASDVYDLVKVFEITFEVWKKQRRLNAYANKLKKDE